MTNDGKPDPGKQEAAEPPPPPPDRDDIEVAGKRCPYCHSEVELEGEPWVLCQACLARHHEACWKEGGEKCSACRHDGQLAPAEEKSPPPEAPAPDKGKHYLDAPVVLVVGGAFLVLCSVVLTMLLMGSSSDTPPEEVADATSDSPDPEPEPEPKPKPKPKPIPKDALEARKQLKYNFDEHAMVAAAREGDLRQIQLFLKAGMTPDAENNRAYRALVIAIMNKHVDIALALIGAGADVRLENKTDGTRKKPLDLAIEHGLFDVIKALIQAGALDGPGGEARGAYLLSHTRDRRALRVLIEAGLDVNANGYTDEPPIFGHLDSPLSLALLIEAGADVDAEDDEGWTPLMRAELENARGVATLREAGAELSVWDRVRVGYERHHSRVWTVIGFAPFVLIFLFGALGNMFCGGCRRQFGRLTIFGPCRHCGYSKNSRS